MTSKVLADSSRNGGTGIHAKVVGEIYVEAGDCVNNVTCANGWDSCRCTAGEGGNSGTI